MQFEKEKGKARVHACKSGETGAGEKSCGVDLEQLFVLFERRDWVDRNGSGRVKGSGAASDDSWPKLPHATTACGAPNCAFELIVWATRLRGVLGGGDKILE